MSETPIKDAWASFEVAALDPLNPTPQGRENARMLFFAGALAAVTELMAAMSRQDGPQAILDSFSAMTKECDQFAASPSGIMGLVN